MYLRVFWDHVKEVHLFIYAARRTSRKNNPAIGIIFITQHFNINTNFNMYETRAHVTTSNKMKGVIYRLEIPYQNLQNNPSLVTLISDVLTSIRKISL